MIPTLAVVGHPNKGKSSIVATLAEDNRVLIGPTPGTTRKADHFTLRVNGEPLYDLVDTPGFQRAGQVFNWLKAQAGDASERPDLVRAFVETHQQDERFSDECALLAPVVDGAGILYVVDGSKPYGAEYELEMEILRWTGRPRMALINMIGPDNHVEAWRQGLGQYFSIVREFDAQLASFEQRLSLLRAFGEIEESWRRPMQRACEVLTGERHKQRQRAASAVSELLQTALQAHVQMRVDSIETISPQVRETLSGRLLTLINKAEQRCRREVQRIYRHENTAFGEAEINVLDGEIFTDQSWQLFGLSKLQLVASGAVSGAIAGGALDLLAGGTSLFMGSLLGGAIGTVTAWFGGPEVAKIELLGTPLGGNVARAGPIRSTNFPWVLLGRACLHHTLVSERNHAKRTEMVSRFTSGENFFDFLTGAERTAMERCFSRLREGESGLSRQLPREVEAVLSRHVSHQNHS